MSFEFFVGRRYFRPKAGKRVVSLISLLATAGVAVGVMVMIVVIAVMSGAETELRERLLSITAHIVVIKHGDGFAGYSEAIRTIRKMDEVEAATPYIYTQVMLRSKSGISGSILRGIEPETAGQVIQVLRPDILQKLGEISADSVPGIVLGKELAALLKTDTGGMVSLILPQGDSGSSGNVPVMRRFRVIGLFESGLYEFDKTLAYIHIAEARKLLQQPDAVSGIEVRVRDVYKAGETAQKIMEQSGFSFQAEDWLRMNRNIFSALRLQKVVMFIILILIVLVAAFNIASALIMMVMEKTRDIAILKAMGATNRSIRKIFVWRGMVIGAIGTFSGLALGFVVCKILEKYHFIDLPRDVYFFSTLPVSFEIQDAAVIAVCTLAICFLATLYPASRAARLHPVEALRYG